MQELYPKRSIKLDEIVMNQENAKVN